MRILSKGEDITKTLIQQVEHHLLKEPGEGERDLWLERCEIVQEVMQTLLDERRCPYLGLANALSNQVSVDATLVAAVAITLVKTVEKMGLEIEFTQLENTEQEDKVNCGRSLADLPLSQQKQS